MSKNIFLILLMTVTAKAQEIVEYNQSLNDIARGGVRVLKDEDGAALLYNPAILAFNKGVRWSVFNLGFGINGQSTLDLVQNFPLSNPANLPQYYGKNIYTGINGWSSMSYPNFGFAAYSSNYLDFIITNPVSPQMNMESYIDYGFVFGGAFLINENLSFGINFKRVVRTGGNAIIDTPTLMGGVSPATLQSALTTGTGYGGDIGLLWRGKSAFNPQVSLVWQDIGYTWFYPNSGTTSPPPLKENLILGVTANQSLGALGWAAGIEYRHIRNTDWELSKKIHTGIEVNAGIIDVRGGFYQGWAAYGLSVDLWFMSLDYAAYGVERGVYSGQNVDWRNQIGLSFDAGFDADFNLTDGGGKRRRLKQRR
jgi:hypothetical protein